jgi:AcrR family transcriptional regulator
VFVFTGSHLGEVHVIDADHEGNRRANQTKARLRRALATLVHEKSYDDIVVKQILARAHVGRSAFYAHFRDKDDLLVSALRERIGGERERMPESRAEIPSWLIRFSRPLFEHVHAARACGNERAVSTRHATVHERLRVVLSDAIAADLRRVASRGLHRSTPIDLLARHVAGSFLLVLEWSVSETIVCDAEDAEKAFRWLVLPILVPAIADGLVFPSVPSRKSS